jgi:hypothetical protein
MKLESAQNAINGAWLTGLVVGLLTLIRAAVAFIFSSSNSRWMVMAILPDLAILFGLAYGVYRKNRVCAALLFAYFLYLLISKARMWMMTHSVPPGILIDGIAMLLCLNGARGAFACHKLRQTTELKRQLTEDGDPRQTEFKL